MKEDGDCGLCKAAFVHANEDLLAVHRKTQDQNDEEDGIEFELTLGQDHTNIVVPRY